MNIYIILASLALIAMISLIAFNIFDLTGLFVESVQNISETSKIVAPIERIRQQAECPSSCDDNNACTSDWCNETSDYLCSHSLVNGTSEGCWGSPTICSTNTCISDKCTTILLTNCCGNNACESSENCNSCESDCGSCPTIISPTQTAIESVSQPNQANTNQTTDVTSNQPTNTPIQITLNHVIINEFTTNGPNGSYDEFVELYNPTNNDIDITGWKLQYKSATGDTWQSKVGSGMTGIIKSKSFFLLASKSYFLAIAPDYRHSANWGLADTGGHLRIIDINGTVIDKVGWGNANEPEGSVAPALEEGRSLERASLITDTDNNSNDFILTVPSPKNSANQ